MTKNFFLALLCATSLSVQAQHPINLGADISMLPQYESASTPYYGKTGSTKLNALNYLRGNLCKFNSMRVRLFVSPTPTSDDPTLVQGLNYVTALGKRIKNYNLDFMLDFHYSDTWADPANQTIPATWTDHSDEALTDSMYSYTKRCLEHLVANGATPDFVQIGNEISYGMLWRSTSDRCYSSSSATPWKRFTTLLNSAAKAVREVTPNAKIVLHIERTGNASQCLNFFNQMKTYNVDYDIIGLSYYPFWHGSLQTLAATLNTLDARFSKPVQIVETAYYYQHYPTSSDFTDFTATWPGTPEGQQQYVEDLCSELAKHSNVTGLYYWFPEENGNGQTKTVLKKWENRGLWDNSTHRPNPALFVIQNFLSQQEKAVGINSTPQASSAATEATIYNLSGQRVAKPAAPGIYIQEGKKFVKP